MSQDANNIFAGIPADLPEELETLLASGAQFRLNRIVSRGHSSPDDHWYDQAETEWVMLLQGEARLEFEGGREILALQPGDHLLIPAHCRHRVAWTAPDRDTLWLALYFIPGHQQAP